MQTQILTITRPDDWHLHLRDGAALQAVIPFSARQMGRAVIMPNLKPPVVTVADALAYRERILAAVPAARNFQPLMTLYLTDRATPTLIREAKAAGIIACKLYPAGATTNSASGVCDLWALLPVLETMAQVGLPLLVHGEVTDEDIDIFDREAVFIERILFPLLQRLPELKLVFEHITTAEAAQLVTEASDQVAATVTPQHLLYNRNAILVGGIKPHYYCLPVLKRETHRSALLKAVSGKQAHKFFLGTDSAPHAQNNKESACGCAGIFSAFAGIELYAEAFEQVDALDKLQAFASENGPRFYGLPENSDTITLKKCARMVPASFAYGDQQLIPLRAQETIAWTLVE
ncbi:MAG: dihydroorotase [Snodgrassella sp.]|nr:dihydroorotase [Snodgrassella sp.]